MSIKIKRNDAGNCIEFQGSSNPVYWNACLSGSVDSTLPATINVINDIRTAQAGVEQYEFFRIPFTEFVDDSGVAFSTAQEVADYITLKGNATASTDVNSGYRGVFDASTNADPTDTSPSNGDWYYVGTEGVINSTTFKTNDIIKYNSTSTLWERIENKNATVAELENSTLNEFDIHVNADYTGTIRNGSALYPYSDLSTAIASSSDKDSLLLKGVNIISSEIVLPHSLSFYGSNSAEIKYSSFNISNGNIFSFEGDMTQEFVFKDITFKNAGGYGLYVRKTAVVEVRGCKFFNNGWNGLGLNTIASEAVSGLLGYDSINTDLQAFYAGVNASNGGAVRLQECTSPLIRESTAKNNLRGFRLQDCGINGGGFVIENQSLQNIESGIYLAAGSLGGCQNITVTINYSSYNSNNGLLCIGGINNKFSQNEVSGNWNAGFCAWGSANTTLRDSGLFDNNRSALNGIGNTGDAMASVCISEAYNLLGYIISVNPAYRFIAEILGTQIHYTGLGSNVDKVGLIVTTEVGQLANNDKNIIKVDDVGFIGQDYAIDLSEVDVTNLRLSLGDNSYQSIGQGAVKAPQQGNYSELPFSNHIMEVPAVDIVVDTLKRTISLHEGVGGNVINTYGINQLQSVISGGKVDILQKSSDKIQLRGLTLGNVYIEGVDAGNNLATMNDSLNGAFSMSISSYKSFLESEVGVSGTVGNSATFFYIESPDGNFEYPLFETSQEANTFDLSEGGSGTSSTTTYADDLTNTIWHIPTTSFVSVSAYAPLNGVYGNSVNVIWNLQSTDEDSNYSPTFTDVVYNIQEGSNVNIIYKPTGDVSFYSISGVPSGYVDNGSAIIGTTEVITDGVGIQHVLGVTKANDFGSDTGTITINVLNDTSNDPNLTTPWTKAVQISGSLELLEQKSNHESVHAMGMGHIDNETSVASTVGNTSDHTWSRPWNISSVIYFAYGSDHSIINTGTIGSGTLGIHVGISAGGEATFEMGNSTNKISGKGGASLFANSGWYGVYLSFSGYRESNPTSTYLSASIEFKVVDLQTGAVTNIPLVWTITGDGGMLNVFDSKTNVKSTKTASLACNTLLVDQVLPDDTEVSMMVRDPQQWLTDYKIGNPYRKVKQSSTTSDFSLSSSSSEHSTQVWLMGDGTEDSFTNGIHNEVRKIGSNYTYLEFVNMSSNDIENVSIPGLS